MAEQVGCFNEDEVPKYLKPYNAEMTTRDVDEASRPQYFSRPSIHKEVKDLREVHDSWVSFEEALLEEYTYEKLKGQGLCEFNQWVSSVKTHESAMHVFLEFERRFARLSKRDRTLVGVDKVLLFVKSIDRKEREATAVQLKDDDGVHGLNEDWVEVERVCQLYD
mgnify:CR=1 FL=1